MCLIDQAQASKSVFVYFDTINSLPRENIPEYTFHFATLNLKPIPMACPLCEGNTKFFFEDERRPYRLCEKCALIFVPAKFHPTREEEKAQYDLHENNPNDHDYRKFLSRLADPLLKKLPPNSAGLDFGCGPGPALSMILKEAGHQVALHDPFYHPNPTALKATYDFITATEVLEHLHHPQRDLEAIWNCLRQSGWLGLMTKRAADREAFAKWHYKQDPTHVCFWSDTSFQWLADHWNARLELIEPDVALFQK